MATGTKGFKGLAVPLNGESQINQITAADDILTITGASGQTGDFIVCENSSGTELFYIDSNGQLVTAGGFQVNAGAYINFAGATALTTAPTTGLTKGDMFLVFASADNPNIAVCISTATNALKYFGGVTSTFGRQT